MAFAIFGPGSCYITRTDVANSTPINIGYIQEFSLDEAGETKQLFGQNQYPLAAARATIKATGKMKAAEVSGIAVNSAFHGEASFSSGQINLASGEAQTVPGTPYQVTVTHSANFDTDLGVLYSSSGLPLTKVAASPATGQYAVNVATGVYTFAAGDTTIAMLITYAYTVAGSGQTKIVTNKLIGTSPLFQIDYSTIYATKNYYIRVYQALSSKLAQSFKLTDFMMPEIDYDIFANSAGQVYKTSYADIG